MSDKMLAKILSKCGAAVHLTVNQHKNYYEDVEYYIFNNSCDDAEELIEEIGQEAMDGMKERNTVIELQFYPLTPIGFYKLYDYDLERILKRALDILEELEDEKNN